MGGLDEWMVCMHTGKRDSKEIGAGGCDFDYIKEKKEEKKKKQKDKQQG